MNQFSPFARLTGGFFVLAVLANPIIARANLVDEEKDLYFSLPLITEPAWPQTGVYLKSFLFDMPNVESRPNAQVGFVFTPGFRWSALGILELNVGFPLVLNPDATGEQELRAGDLNPNLKKVPNWDDHPDFDLPGLEVGLKGTLIGKEAKDGFFLAVGVQTSLPVFQQNDKYAVTFFPPKNDSFHSSSWRVFPYVTLAYGWGRFSPQLQMGASFRLDEEMYHPQVNDMESGQFQTRSMGYTDFVFNLALPFALPFEGTVPMLEINGVISEQRSFRNCTQCFALNEYNTEVKAQIFITPAVTFLPKGSPAQLGFACMIPVADSDFRENEGFRFLINFSYQLDMLSIPPIESDENKGDGGTQATSTPADL